MTNPEAIKLHKIIHEDVETPNSYPWEHTIDFAIPANCIVTGSGVVVTTSNGTPVDEMPGYGLGSTYHIRYFSGPHPTDPAKWRVQITQAEAKKTGLRAWVATLGPQPVDE